MMYIKELNLCFLPLFWSLFSRIFRFQVIRELPEHKSTVNALLADGHKFAHPLRHLGKAAKVL